MSKNYRAAIQSKVCYDESEPLLQCTPLKTITIKYDGANETEYKISNVYRYEFKDYRYKVYFSRGFLWFTPEEFFSYFKKIS